MASNPSPADPMTIAGGYVQLLAVALPKNMDPIQAIETRRAFFAGASHHHYILQTIGSDAVSEERGVEILESITAELEEFGRQITRGEA